MNDSHEVLRRSAALALILAAVGGPLAAQHTVVATSVTQHGDLLRTDTTVQVGDDPIDRFIMHRLTSAISQATPRGVLLLLGPLANPFSFFETDEKGIYERAFAPFFAHHGFEIWGYSPRGTGLVAGSCESGVVDCSAMADWGLAATVDDITYIRQQIEQAHPGVEPILGGYSLGAAMVQATLNLHPDDWSAAMILESPLYSEDPEIRALNSLHCATVEQWLAGGLIFDGQTLPLTKIASLLAAIDPDGPTPFPGFPEGFTNHQVLVFSVSVPQFGPLSQTPTFVRVAGSVEEDRFFFSPDDRVIAHFLVFNDYFDLRTLRDIDCSLAGERTFTDNLGAFTGPVYLLGAGLSYLDINYDLVKILGSTDITFNEQPEFGHGDFFFARHHRELLEQDLLRWLDRVAPPMPQSP